MDMLSLAQYTTADDLLEALKGQSIYLLADDRPKGSPQGYTYSDTESLKARLFGLMHRLASFYVKQYYSDLYYDARWLENLDVDIPFGSRTKFYYGVGEMGTHIGTGRSEVMSGGRENVFEFSLFEKDNRPYRGIYVTVTKIR